MIFQKNMEFFKLGGYGYLIKYKAQVIRDQVRDDHASVFHITNTFQELESGVNQN